MAKKKSVKKAPKAAAPKAVKKAKAPKEETTRGDPKGSPFAYCRELLLGQKHSDEEILALVTKRFPDVTFNQGYTSSERWTLNQALTKKLVRLAKNDAGKLVPKASLPKKSASGKKKYTKDNDPLKRVANIDVHAKRAAKKRPATPKAEPVAA